MHQNATHKRFLDYREVVKRALINHCDGALENKKCMKMTVRTFIICVCLGASFSRRAIVFNVNYIYYDQSSWLITPKMLKSIEG